MQRTPNSTSDAERGNELAAGHSYRTSIPRFDMVAQEGSAAMMTVSWNSFNVMPRKTAKSSKGGQVERLVRMLQSKVQQDRELVHKNCHWHLRRPRRHHLQVAGQRALVKPQGWGDIHASKYYSAELVSAISTSLAPTALARRPACSDV